MIPLRITLEGFMSYREKQVIDFTGEHLWMLWGPNGVGKSAVFDAITFALYNTHRAGSGARGSTRELINHYADRLEVAFDFLVDDVRYRVHRTYARGRGTRSTCQALLVDSDDISAVPITGTDDEDGLKYWVLRTIGLDYPAFTSSVLLLQGKSERLLEAEPRKRYDILKELIDLSHYEKLHATADERRRFYKGKVDSLTQLLAAAPPINDEELAAAQSELERQNHEWVDVQREVGHLTSLVEQTKLHEQLISELVQEQKQLQDALNLLAREDEINNSFEEWQTLSQVLPTLDRLLQERGLIAEVAQRIISLECKSQQLETDLLEVEREKEQANHQVVRLAQALSGLQQAEVRYAQRLAELAQLVTNLEHIEQWQEEMAELETKLAHFPTDIEQRLQDAEEQACVLAEKARVLPWLRSFAQTRIGLASALEREREAVTEVERQRETLQGYTKQCDQLNVELVGVRADERRLFQGRASAGQSYKEASARFKNFENAAAKPVCDLCGQPISSEHAQVEKVRLGQQVGEAKRTFDELEIAHQNAFAQQQSLEKNLTTLESQVEATTECCNQWESKRQQAKTQGGQYTEAIRNAFVTIQAPFKEYIVAVSPADNAGWLATSYPNEIDLEALQREVNTQVVQENELKILRQNHQNWQKLYMRKALVQQQLEQLTAVTDIETAKTAREEKLAIQQDQQDIESKIEQHQQEHEQKKEDAQKASETCHELRELVQQCRNDLSTKRATHAEKERILQAFMGSLPADWQELGVSLDTNSLRELMQRRDELVPYAHLHEEMSGARQAKKVHGQRINVLETRIEAFTSEACRPVAEVEQELDNAKSRQQLVDADRNVASNHLVNLESQQKHHRELEQQKHDAERQHHLYDLLSDLLGRSGLQLYLLRRAESAIVEIANNILHGLSHGRIRLELRRDSDALATNTEKALDLVVYDYDTGQHSISISLASGSQRFRIAVSLALAIGRYTSREARRIESVIIDEGFGTLDKTGRDDMIKELTSLGQQLKRIILVSHQDEFASAFHNCYSFKLVDKATYVMLLAYE